MAKKRFRDIRLRDLSIKSIQDAFDSIIRSGNMVEEERDVQFETISSIIEQPDIPKVSVTRSKSQIALPSDSEGGNVVYTDAYVEFSAQEDDSGYKVPHSELSNKEDEWWVEIESSTNITSVVSTVSDDARVTFSNITDDEAFVVILCHLTGAQRVERHVVKIYKEKATKEYYIETASGTVIKNSSNSVTLQLKFRDGVLDQNVTSGNIVLYDGSGVEITDPAYSGATGYAATITESQVTDYLIVKIYDKDNTEYIWSKNNVTIADIKDLNYTLKVGPLSIGIPSDADGSNPVYTNANTLIEVINNQQTSLVIDNSNPYSNNTFRISNIANETNCTASLSQTNGQTQATASIDSVSADSGSFEFDLIITDSNGSFTTTYLVDFRKVKNGADGTSGVSNRLDIAWGDNSDGSGNTAFPSGLLGDVTYAKATKVASNNYQGTRLVTWDSGGTEPAVSTTIGDYEWTRSTSTLNRIDLAYSDSDNGVGNLQLPTGKYSTTYIPATPLSSNYYIGTNVVSWNADETEPAVSATVGDYEWGKFRGDDGSDATSLYAVSIQYDTRISSSVPSSAGEWALKDAAAYDAVGQNLANINNFQLYKDDVLDARFAHYFNYLANLPYGTALYLQLQQGSNIANYKVTLISYSSDYINLSVNYLSSTTDFSTATEFLPYTPNNVYFNFSIGFQPMTDVDHQIGAKDSDGDTILGNITDNLVNLDHNGENPTYTNSYLDVVYIDELGASYQYASSITSISYDKYTLKNITATNLTNTASTVSNLRRFTVSNYTYNSKIGYSYISAELWVYRNGAERFAGYINHRYKAVNDAFPSGKMTTTSGTVTNKSLSYETWSFGSEVYSTGIAVCDPVTDNDIDIGAKSKNVDVIVIIDLTVSPGDESFNFRLMNNGSQVGDTITGVFSTKKTVVFSSVDVTTNHLFSLVYASNDNANQDITAIQEVSIEVIHKN